jgi:Calpain family cysteine protease
MDYAYADGADAGAQAAPAPAKKSKSRNPQATIISFWSKFVEKNPSKVNCIFPPSLYADLLPQVSDLTGSQGSRHAAESYQDAVKECKDRVAKIVRECNRTNVKFVDPDFDIESDFGSWNCLEGLIQDDDAAPAAGYGYSVSSLKSALDTLLGSQMLGADVTTAELNLNSLQQVLRDTTDSSTSRPGSVHRVDWIYDNPKFTVDGYNISDIRQGQNGDCWFLAAVATLCSVQGVLDKICVARDEECGVYGFVFFRDGEWIWTVVDDNLYLQYSDFVGGYDPRGELSRKFKERYQTGSDALYYASCSEQNETWLPLLEKAFAKAHGDYEATSGGLPGEAVEDLTGGVTTIIETNKILSKQRLWKEMLNEKKEFLFAICSKSDAEASASQESGLTLQHAYSIMRAVEVETEDKKSSIRFVKIRLVFKSTMK